MSSPLFRNVNVHMVDQRRKPRSGDPWGIRSVDQKLNQSVVLYSVRSVHPCSDSDWSNTWSGTRRYLLLHQTILIVKTPPFDILVKLSLNKLIWFSEVKTNISFRTSVFEIEIWILIGQKTFEISWILMKFLD